MLLLVVGWSVWRVPRVLRATDFLRCQVRGRAEPLQRDDLHGRVALLDADRRLLRLRPTGLASGCLHPGDVRLTGLLVRAGRGESRERAPGAVVFAIHRSLKKYGSFSTRTARHAINESTKIG